MEYKQNAGDGPALFTVITYVAEILERQLHVCGKAHGFC